jgi:hypothetical protein
MKIAVECQSPLLQKSLEIFLKNYISSAKKSDIVIRDTPCMKTETKPCFYIGNERQADLMKPFSKSQLILALERRYKELLAQQHPTHQSGESMDFSILEKRIDTLTQEYKENILRAVRTFYEN